STGARQIERAADGLFARRFQGGTLDAAVPVPRPDKTRGAELLRFLDQVVEVLARIARAVRHDEPPDFTAGVNRAAEHREVRGGKRLRERLELHPRTEVRLVGP